jgi:hypothetical protein
LKAARKRQKLRGRILTVLKLGNIQLIEGNLDETLSETLKKVDKVDFVFFDGNHRYEPTMRISGNV